MRVFVCVCVYVRIFRLSWLAGTGGTIHVNCIPPNPKRLHHARSNTNQAVALPEMSVYRAVRSIYMFELPHSADNRRYLSFQ